MWIVLKARSDWLVQLRISFAISGKKASRFASGTREEII